MGRVWAFWASAAPEVATSELAGWCWARQTLLKKRVDDPSWPSPLHWAAAAPATKGRLIRCAVDALTRSSRRETRTADHLPPRAAGMPRASSSAAMTRNDTQPAAFSSFTMSARSDARACALARWAALPAARAFAVSFTPRLPPSFTPRRLAAAKAAFVRRRSCRSRARPPRPSAAIETCPWHPQLPVGPRSGRPRRPPTDAKGRQRSG